MAYNFLPCERTQSYLLPPSLADWLPEDHLAWFVLDAVAQIDLKPFYKKYRTDGVGNSAFNLSMMVALLIYSYCTGERSSRRVEKHCQTDVAYKVLTANQSPDHCTISRFRKENPQLDWVLYIIFINKVLQFYTEIPKATFRCRLQIIRYCKYFGYEIVARVFSCKKVKSQST